MALKFEHTAFAGQERGAGKVHRGTEGVAGADADAAACAA
jgi:hypothetical protein